MSIETSSIGDHPTWHSTEIVLDSASATGVISVRRPIRCREDGRVRHRGWPQRSVSPRRPTSVPRRSIASRTTSGSTSAKRSFARRNIVNVFEPFTVPQLKYTNRSPRRPCTNGPPKSVAPLSSTLCGHLERPRGRVSVAGEELDDVVLSAGYRHECFRSVGPHRRAHSFVPGGRTPRCGHARPRQYLRGRDLGRFGCHTVVGL